MRLNIVKRIENLCREYNKLKYEKHQLLGRATKVTSDVEKELNLKGSYLQGILTK